MIVGTDCSGIDAPIVALQKLGVRFTYAFASEIDEKARKTLLANLERSRSQPKHFYNDMTLRDENTLPKIDLYVSGFPCQPFSISGSRKGFDHTSGKLFFSCIRTIRKTQPSYFVLENVKGLYLHDSGKTWKIIEAELEKLSVECGYVIKHALLNTLDYGIPQNRERIYIVGSLNDFSFPPPKIALRKSLKDFVDTSIPAVSNITRGTTLTQHGIVRNDVIASGMLERIPSNAVFVDFAFKKHNYPNSDRYCPCITADSRIWCVPLKRYASIGELASLQGFPSDYIFPVSEKQAKHQIGNAMSVNVLEAIFSSLFC